MQPRAIYLVVGQQGDHSDFETWDVCAYEHREQAETHARIAKDEALLIWERWRASDWRPPCPLCKYDPLRPGNASEREYIVEELDIFVHFDQWQETQGLV